MDANLACCETVSLGSCFDKNDKRFISSNKAQKSRSP